MLWPRLEQDGWKRKQEWKVNWTGHRFVIEQPMIYHKTCPSRPFSLVMTTSIVEFAHHFAFALLHKGKTIALEGAEWADWDRRGRLVFVRAGKVFAANLDEAGTIAEKELADFNSSRPENKRSPGWARRW